MSDERVDRPVKVWSSFASCQACGKTEDDGVAVLSLAANDDDGPPSTRRGIPNPLAVLCWRCLRPVVEELYENPPE